MHQILTIAWREITRLRKRFGGASPLAIFLMLAVLGLAAFALRNGATLGNGLYRVGVSGDVPPIQDSRFTVVKVDPAQGRALLVVRAGRNDGTVKIQATAEGLKPAALEIPVKAAAKSNDWPAVRAEYDQIDWRAVKKPRKNRVRAKSRARIILSRMATFAIFVSTFNKADFS